MLVHKYNTSFGIMKEKINTGRLKMVLQENLEVIIKNSVNAILSDTLAHLRKRSTFADIVASTKKNVQELGRQVLSQVIEEVERQFDAERDRHKIVVRNKNKSRRLITEFGDIDIRHTLYFDKEAKRYFFAVDDLLRIEKYTRIEEGLQAKLLSDATHTSYGKAAVLSNNVVSRQSVYNLAKKVAPIEAPRPKTNWNAANLFIEADEDHIHLKNGKPGEVKLVYVHEGRDYSSGRAELINPRYFTSVQSDYNEIWDRVDNYLLSSYHLSRANVFLSGDGAAWIKAGLNVFPNVVYNLDKFHLSKALMYLARGNNSLLSKLRRTVYDGDRAAFENLYLEITQRKSFNAATQRAIHDSALYILSNFEAISNESRCSAEGHVSHVLSSRMSSRPMAWTKEGAGKIASLRAYLYNRGDFATLIREWKRANVLVPGTRPYNAATTSKYGSRTAPTTYHIPGLENVTGALARCLKILIK